jgi:sarcosine oxidase, subunit gamma
VSAPERSDAPAPPGVELARVAADIVEIAALRDGAAPLTRIAGELGIALVPTGRVAAAASGALVLSVRPGRWLLLFTPGPPGERAARWQAALAGQGVAVDQSSALAGLHVCGSAVRELLARGCRLDLAPEVFAPGRAAATIMVQLPVVLAALPSGLLLLTPATTAAHLEEWLAAAAQPFGLRRRPDAIVEALYGEPSE